MTWDKLTHVLRILDAENRLLERADTKAISLLSILGVFMVFFIVYYRIIPVNPVTVVLVIIYSIFAILAIVSLIMTVRPRIQSVSEDAGADKTPPSEPAFFAGIKQFTSLAAYRKTLEEMTKDEATMIDVYTRQIYSLAMINAAKYKNVQRAVFLVITALAVELIITAYLFVFYLGEGRMPPIN